jgi:hypothetical protein
VDVTIRLSKMVHGQPAHQPVTLALKDLRHSMLVDFCFPPAKVDHICGLVVEMGQCMLGDDGECGYLIERITH